MSDTPRTHTHIEGLRRDPNVSGCDRTLNFARQLERELTAAQSEIARLKAGGCARDQRTTQFCGEALKLQERVRRLEKAGDRMATAWDKEYLTQAEAEAIIDDWYGSKEATP